eukprot:gene29869-36064_t
MMISLLYVALLVTFCLYCSGFSVNSRIRAKQNEIFWKPIAGELSRADSRLNLLPFHFDSLNLADISVTEEEVLDVAGQASNLPSPWVAVGFAALVFAAIAVLQFSLGDLTKEEGEARVKDFLQLRRDTERKRGYFD